MSGPARIVCPDAASAAREGARRIAGALALATERRGVASFALSGGHTPLPLYRALLDPACRNQVLWDRLELFWGDERCVPPDHPESNYGTAKAEFLDALTGSAGPAPRIHRIAGEDPDPDLAARRYEDELRASVAPGPGGFPALDVLLLGIGEDGHVASMFPGSATLVERHRAVVAAENPGGWHRITITPPVVHAAREVIVLVAGASKAPVLQRVFHGPRDPEKVPAQILEGCTGRVLWLMDSAAAAMIEGPGPPECSGAAEPGT